MPPPQITLQKKEKRVKINATQIIFESYCGTVLQWGIRGDGGRGRLKITIKCTNYYC